MQDRRVYYLFHGRFPSEKAASIYTHKNADAFARLGVDVTVIVPRRLGRKSMGNILYRVVHVPIIDLFYVPVFRKLAFWISFIIFSFFSCIYLILRAPRSATIISNESLPLFLATFFFRNTMYEMHDFPESHFFFYKTLFQRTQRVLATNEWKKEEVVRKFSISEKKIVVEPNGVDLEQFSLNIGKKEARRKVGIPEEGDVVVYTGHLYSWKGVDVLAQAASDIPEMDIYFVGGTRDGIQEFRQKYSDRTNIHIVGHKLHEEIPLWQRAADVLVLPNTGKEEISVLYTSPMKLFEYMASGTPIIAADIISIKQVVDEQGIFFFPADDSKKLGLKIREVFNSAGEARRKAGRAFKLVQTHSWEQRARRIMQFVSL